MSEQPYRVHCLVILLICFPKYPRPKCYVPTVISKCTFGSANSDVQGPQCINQRLCIKDAWASNGISVRNNGLAGLHVSVMRGPGDYQSINFYPLGDYLFLTIIRRRGGEYRRIKTQTKSRFLFPNIHRP